MKQTLLCILYTLIAIITFVITGCGDYSTQTTQNTLSSLVSPTSESSADQTIYTSNYIFEVYNDPQGDLFSIRRTDQSVLVNRIALDDLMQSYPDVFDELVLDGMSTDLDEKIYYDDQNSNRIR